MQRLATAAEIARLGYVSTLLILCCLSCWGWCQLWATVDASTKPLAATTRQPVLSNVVRGSNSRKFTMYLASAAMFGPFEQRGVLRTPFGTHPRLNLCYICLCW